MFLDVPRGFGIAYRSGTVSVLAFVWLFAIQGCGAPTAPSHPADGPWPYPSGSTFLDLELIGCPSEAEIAAIKEVAVQFEAATGAGEHVCTQASGSRDLTDVQRRGYWALIMMKRLRYSQPLPWTARPLYDWFSTIVSLVIFDSSGQNSRTWPKYRAIIIEQNPENTKFFSEHPWEVIDRLIGGFVHEARHLEFGGHTCGTRDRRVSDLGAFGAHNFYFQWNGLYSDPAIIPLEWRAHHVRTACVQRRSAFCDEPKNVRCE